MINISQYFNIRLTLSFIITLYSTFNDTIVSMCLVQYMYTRNVVYQLPVPVCTKFG
jgi:hypothetical protein